MFYLQDRIVHMGWIPSNVQYNCRSCIYQITTLYLRDKQTKMSLNHVHFGGWGSLACPSAEVANMLTKARGGSDRREGTS
jgi:hypothetical protein